MKPIFLLRQLSHGENAFYNARLSITTMSKISGDISCNTLQSCFEKLLDTHPLLQCCVTENKGDRHFICRPTGQQKVKEITLSRDDEAHQYFQKTINSSLNPQKSLVEITILKSSQDPKNKARTYIITNVSHIISDGVCNIELHRELLTLCDQTPTGQLFDNNKSEPSPKKSIPQAIESRLPQRPDGATIEDTVKQHLEIIKKDTHQTLGADSHNTNNAQIEVLTQTLSEDKTLKILAWCKTRSLSFNNVFTAALMMAANSETSHHSFLVRNAVDLRTKVKPTVKPNEFITSATSIITSTTVTNDDLESLSRKVSIATSKALLQTPFFENHIANKEIIKQINIPLAFHLSNVGRLNINNEFSEFSLDNIIIAPATSCGNTLPIVVTTYQNCLSITTHALKELYPQELIQNLLSEAINLMLLPQNY